jgi:hypothetical protein
LVADLWGRIEPLRANPAEEAGRGSGAGQPPGHHPLPRRCQPRHALCVPRPHASDPRRARSRREPALSDLRLRGGRAMSANQLQTGCGRASVDQSRPLSAITGADRIFDRRITRAEPPYLVLGEIGGSVIFPPVTRRAPSTVSRSRPGPEQTAATGGRTGRCGPRSAP